MRNLVISSVLLVLLVQACVIRSIHPFYQPSDLLEKAEIIGTWDIQFKKEPSNNIEENRIDRWVIKPSKSDSKLYEIEMHRKGKPTSNFTVGLFKINGQHYLDFFPEDLLDDDKIEASPLFYLHIQPVHSLARIDFTAGSMEIKWFNEKKLRELFRQNKIKIKHETTGSGGDEEYVLTASTDDLQKFISKYGSAEDAFGGENGIEHQLIKSRP